MASKSCMSASQICTRSNCSRPTPAFSRSWSSWLSTSRVCPAMDALQSSATRPEVSIRSPAMISLLALGDASIRSIMCATASEDLVGLAQLLANVPDAFAVGRKENRIASAQLDGFAAIGREDAPAGNDVAELAAHDVAAKHARAALPNAHRGGGLLDGLVLAQPGVGNQVSDRQLGRGRFAESGARGILDHSQFDSHVVQSLQVAPELRDLGARLMFS